MAAAHRSSIALSLLGVLGIGVAIGWFAASRTEVASLETDLDADAAYFFADQQMSPIRGVLRRGAEVQVHMRKGGAVYVSVDTVLNRDAFEQATFRR